MAIESDMKMSQFDLIAQPHGNITGHFRKGDHDSTHIFYDAIIVDVDVVMSCTFAARSLAIDYCSRDNHLKLVSDGPYSRLIVSFHLQRLMGSFIIEVYAPCVMLVVLSWVGFWINREATADRISLGELYTCVKRRAVM